MDRRKFMRVAGTGITSGALAEAVVSAQIAATPARQSSDTKAKSRKALMKDGTQHGDSNEILRVLAGFGVDYICRRLPSERLDEHWSVDGLSQLGDRVDR